MYSFDRNPTTGLPCTTVSLTSSRTCTYPSWAQSAAILAEYGTMQLEFKYLSHHTGERKYWDAVEKPIRLLQRTSHPHHLYPTFINPKTGRWSSNKVRTAATTTTSPSTSASTSTSTSGGELEREIARDAARDREMAGLRALLESESRE